VIGVSQACFLVDIDY